jgi:hypothetical protein
VTRAKSTLRTVVKRSSRGRLYLDWEPMPRVPDEYLECVVYLYPDISSADAGKKVGGTGFIVRVDLGFRETFQDFYYVVTNKHVIDGGSTCVRFNNVDGEHEAFDFDERNWIRSPDAGLAIYPLVDPDPNRLVFRPITYNQFLTEDQLKHLKIGIGDEVFFAGRFMNAEGADKNRPSLRFGTIAQAHPTEIDNELSFLVEARSIPGYSGSPVLVYSMRGSPRSVVPSVDVPVSEVAFGPLFLGVDRAHILDVVDAEDERGNKLPFKIRTNTGMMAVVPFWKLSDLLFRQDVCDMREELQRKRMKQRAASPDVQRAASDSVRPASDANPTHREDFTSLLNAAVKTPAQED